MGKLKRSLETFQPFESIFYVEFFYVFNFKNIRIFGSFLYLGFCHIQWLFKNRFATMNQRERQMKTESASARNIHRSMQLQCIMQGAQWFEILSGGS